MIADAVFQGRKQAVMGIKAQDVPGIDHRAAVDRPLEQIDDLRQQVRRIVELPAVAGELAAGHQAVDLTLHAGRSAGHDVCLVLGRCGVPHAGKDLGQMHVLELRCPLAGKLRIEMLPRAAKGLPPLGGLLL